MYRSLCLLRSFCDAQSLCHHNKDVNVTFLKSLILLCRANQHLLSKTIGLRSNLYCNRAYISYWPRSDLLTSSIIINTVNSVNNRARRGIQHHEHGHRGHESADKHRHCWNCGRNTSPVLELFFCDCGVVQKPAIELTYFDLMLVEPSFDIDIKKLSEVFKETQKKLHPDKFSSKSETERKLAQEQSSLLNKAYTVLLKPLSRALYLLELQGITIEDNSKLTDSEFLMEIMQINEKISSIESDSDLNSVEAENSSQIEDCLLQLSHTFKLKDFSKAKFLTIRLRYYTTIQERLFELRRSQLG